MAQQLSLPSEYGGFTCVAQSVLELPARFMLPRDDLRSSHGVYWCERFCQRIFPSLADKHAEKPSKDGVPAVLPTASVFFWRCKQSRVGYDDVMRRFKGKESPIPWWGLNALLHRHYYEPYDLPFSLGTDRLLAFMPLRGKSEKEPGDLVLVQAYGKVSTAPHPEWWVDEFDEGNGKAECPENSIYLSWQLH